MAFDARRLVDQFRQEIGRIRAKIVLFCRFHPDVSDGLSQVHGAMPTPRPASFVEQAGSALHAEGFSGGLAPRHWVIQQDKIRRAHLLVQETRSGSASLRSTVVKFKAPALLWLPGELEGDLQVEAGAQGYFVAVSEDLLTRTVAGSPERGGFTIAAS